jgi:hypothetical protein
MLLKRYHEVRAREFFSRESRAPSRGRAIAGCEAFGERPVPGRSGHVSVGGCPESPVAWGPAARQDVARSDSVGSSAAPSMGI